MTPDGRYFVVRGRLWRMSNPGLAPDIRERHVKALMNARRVIAVARKAADPEGEAAARKRVHRAKVALGERGPVWWDKQDGDHNRRLAVNTPYADWYARLTPDPS